MEAYRRILLVEDDPRDAELTLAALSGYKLANDVILARDGAEAMDYLRCRGAFVWRRRGNPCVVLIDLKMPKVDGIQVVREIKTDDALRTIPVVVLTSSREMRDVDECYRLGVNAYVVKPVHFDDFVRAVRDVWAFWAVVNEPPPFAEPAPAPR